MSDLTPETIAALRTFVHLEESPPRHAIMLRRDQAAALLAAAEENARLRTVAEAAKDYRQWMYSGLCCQAYMMNSHRRDCERCALDDAIAALDAK